MRRGSLPALVAGLILLGAQPAAAITFGTPTGPGAYGNVGAMVVTVDTERYQVCSGSLIAAGSATEDAAFLTAAHCVVGFEDLFASGDVFVNFRHDLAAAGDIAVSDVHVHPRYRHDRANPHDLAVLEVDASLAPDVALAVAGEGYLGSVTRLRSRTFVAVGFGLVRDAKQAGPLALAEASERMSVEQRVQSLTRAWVTFSQNPSTGNGGSCSGDSGGPHLRAGTNIIVSITVTGDRFCRATDTTYRLDTSAAHDFLDSFLP